MTTRRNLILMSALASVAGLGAMGPAIAQPSNRPTRMIIGFPPGSGTDAVARAVAEQIRGKYAETIIPENKPGAGGRIALDYLKKADADGSVIMSVPSSLLSVYPFTYPKLSYDPLKDFTLAAVTGKFTFVLAVGPAVPLSVKTPAELAAWIKQQPKQPTMFSGNAQGTTSHFLGLSYGQKYGVNVSYVPYQGGAETMRGLLAGDFPFVLLTEGYLLSFVKSPSLRILAIASEERSKWLPDIPTFKELGQPDLVFEEWTTLLLPKNAPQAQVDKLFSAWKSVSGSDMVRNVFSANGINVVAYDGAAATELLKSDMKKIAPLVKASGFTFDE